MALTFIFSTMAYADPNYKSPNYKWTSAELHPKDCTTIASCGAAKDKMATYLYRCKQPGAGCAEHDRVNASNSYYRYMDTEKRLKIQKAAKEKHWTKEELVYKPCKTVQECRSQARKMSDYWHQCLYKRNDPQLVSMRCDPNDMDTADMSRSRYITEAKRLAAPKVATGEACKNVSKIEKAMQECGERDDGICSGDALTRARRACENEKNKKDVLVGAAIGAILNPQSGRYLQGTKPTNSNKAGQNK